MDHFKQILAAGVFLLFSINAWPQNWQVIGKMDHPVYGAQAIVLDSLIYIFGGYSDSLNKPINDIQAYNPLTKKWHLAGRMDQNRYGFVLDQLDDVYVIACGGVWESTPNSNSIERWNFNTKINAFGEIFYSDLNFNRVFSTGHIYQNKLYLFGGERWFEQFTGDTLELPFIISFDLNLLKLEVIEDSLYRDSFLPSYHHTSVRQENKVFIFGGVHFGIFNHVYIFDLISHELKTISSLMNVRAGSQAVLFDDQIYLIGGYNETERALSSTEIFNTNNFLTDSGPSLNYQRQELMAVAYNNELYIFGGKDINDRTVPWIEKLDMTNTSTILSNVQISKKIKLLDNYPNPFNSSTVIPFELASAADIRIDIFSLSGQNIKTLIQEKYQAGSYTTNWDGTDRYNNYVASGVYIYQLRTGGSLISKKMILIR